MLALGELEVWEPDQLDAIGNFKNIKRLIRHMQGAYPIKLQSMVEQEGRFFKNVHHLTSSAQFLKAVREKDLEKARQIA